MQLIQREKMRRWGNPCRVAHELNNPIGFVYSNVTTLEDFVKRLRGMLEVYRGLSLSPADQAQVQAEWERRKIDYALRYLDSMTQGIRKGAERARKIVRDLRVFARSQDDVWQPVDLHEEIESSLTLLNHLLKDRVVVHRKLGDLPHVECIRSSIDQVFLNLLANAAQAIDGRGPITIETRREDEKADTSFVDTRPGLTADVTVGSSTPSSPPRPWARDGALSSISQIAKKHGGRSWPRVPPAAARSSPCAPISRRLT
jgi:signal transduction histidine kinase